MRLNYHLRYPQAKFSSRKAQHIIEMTITMRNRQILNIFSYTDLRREKPQSTATASTNEVSSNQNDHSERNSRENSMISCFREFEPELVNIKNWLVIGERDPETGLTPLDWSSRVTVPRFQYTANFYAWIRTPGRFNHLFFALEGRHGRIIGTDCAGCVLMTAYPTNDWVVVFGNQHLRAAYARFVETVEEVRQVLATLPRFTIWGDLTTRTLNVSEVRNRRLYGPTHQFHFEHVAVVNELLGYLAYYGWNDATHQNSQPDESVIKPEAFLSGAVELPYGGLKALPEELLEHPKHHVFEAIPLRIVRNTIKEPHPELQELFRDICKNGDHKLISSTSLNNQFVRCSRDALVSRCNYFEALEGAQWIDTDTSETRLEFSIRALQAFVRGLSGLPFDKQLDHVTLFELYQIYNFLQCKCLRLGNTLNHILLTQYLTKLDQPAEYLSAILELGFAEAAEPIRNDLKLMLQLVQ
jgi:hypothetical protein